LIVTEARRGLLGYGTAPERYTVELQQVIQRQPPAAGDLGQRLLGWPALAVEDIGDGGLADAGS
jgi:hypothetical protein